MTTTPTSRREALETAISRGGGIIKFAAAMGVKHQAVSMWRKKNCVPFVRAAKIEALYGVPREDLVDPEQAAAYLMPPVAQDLL